ncbi:cell wall hydrolase [Phenylobacterium sp.]|uniref:cell wall hydrolase n=1 Tax=Phenylobacterium sp. TaxID=1871053 RepID=UPI002FDA87CB
MQHDNKVRANWRALTGAALVGSAVGLALGGAYMAGGMARAATDHERASRLAAAAAEGFSEQALQDAAARMDPGVLRVARRHDPFTVAGAAERDRQNAILVARLERQAPARGESLMLRASLGVTPSPAAPFRLGGALEASREVECLTQAVYYEARGETPSGQAAVAQVVLNRVRHPAFPKTVCGVVFQGANSRVCQFSFACNGAMRAGVDRGAWRRAERVAHKALSGEVMADVGKATHFHTTAVAPGWGLRMARVTQVGQHVFYRFHRDPAPSRLLARADHVSPEQTEAPVYARPPGATGEPAGAQLAERTPVDADFRLTSAVVDTRPVAVPLANADLGSEAAAAPAKPEARPEARTEAAPKPAAKPAKPEGATQVTGRGDEPKAKAAV